MPAPFALCSQGYSTTVVFGEGLTVVYFGQLVEGIVDEKTILRDLSKSFVDEILADSDDTDEPDDGGDDDNGGGEGGDNGGGEGGDNGGGEGGDNGGGEGGDNGGGEGGGDTPA